MTFLNQLNKLNGTLSRALQTQVDELLIAEIILWVVKILGSNQQNRSLHLPRWSCSSIPWGSTSAAAKAEVSVESETRWGWRSAKSVQLPVSVNGSVYRSEYEERQCAHQQATGTLKTDWTTHCEKLTLKMNVDVVFYTRSIVVQTNELTLRWRHAEELRVGVVVERRRHWLRHRVVAQNPVRSTWRQVDAEILRMPNLSNRRNKWLQKSVEPNQGSQSNCQLQGQ